MTFRCRTCLLRCFAARWADEAFRGGVAIGDQILDLAAVAQSGMFTGEVAAAVQAGAQGSLNALVALAAPAWSALRLALSRALRDGAAGQALLQACLVLQADAEYAVPARIGDSTDFYTPVHHATNIGVCRDGVASPRESLELLEAV